MTGFIFDNSQRLIIVFLFLEIHQYALHLPLLWNIDKNLHQILASLINVYRRLLQMKNFALICQ